ncbi:unnamed protein product, partial [Staurois parvus]
ISVPKAVTPSYTRAYPAALLRQVFFTYLTLRSHDVSPAASPAISSGRCGIRLLCPVPVTSGRTGAAAGGGKFKNFKKCHFFFFTFYICFVLCPACILSVLS